MRSLTKLCAGSFLAVALVIPVSSGMANASEVGQVEAGTPASVSTSSSPTYTLNTSDSNNISLKVDKAYFKDSVNNEILTVNNDGIVIDRIQKDPSLNYSISNNEIKFSLNKYGFSYRSFPWQCALGTWGTELMAGTAAVIGVVSGPVTMGAGTAAGLTAAASLGGAAAGAAASCFG